MELKLFNIMLQTDYQVLSMNCIYPEDVGKFNMITILFCIGLIVECLQPNEKYLRRLMPSSSVLLSSSLILMKIPIIILTGGCIKFNSIKGIFFKYLTEIETLQDFTGKPIINQSVNMLRDFPHVMM